MRSIYRRREKKMGGLRKFAIAAGLIGGLVASMSNLEFGNTPGNVKVSETSIVEYGPGRFDNTTYETIDNDGRCKRKTVSRVFDFHYETSPCNEADSTRSAELFHAARRNNNLGSLVASSQ